jgi:predicted nucleotidyltransferase
MAEIDEILDECRRRLRDHYGEELADIVLYGSIARGDEDAESDIDLLVLLKSDFNRWEQIKVIVRLLYPVQMKCDRYISAKPVHEVDYREGKHAFLRRAKSEGVLL